MLPGVLLHVIETARPVDGSGYGRAHLERPVHDVYDAHLVPVHHLEHAPAAERAGVVRLPARRGIERRGREHDLEVRSGGRARDHGRLALLAVGIGVVQTVDHGFGTRGSVTPASANPAARSRQLSQWRHGWPPGSGS